MLQQLVSLERKPIGHGFKRLAFLLSNQHAKLVVTAWLQIAPPQKVDKLVAERSNTNKYTNSCCKEGGGGGVGEGQRGARELQGARGKRRKGQRGRGEGLEVASIIC